jgi:hypothetical protein
MLEKLKKQLPNIPEEVIKYWLLPFAEIDGLPSSPDNNWDEKKTGELLHFWNDAKWEKVKMDLTKVKYSNAHNKTIDGLLDAYVKGANNSYFQHLGEDGEKRFSNCLRYILKNGAFPVAPILSVTHKNEYEVLDGNHRFAAYEFLSRIHSAIKSMSPVERESVVKKFGVSCYFDPPRDDQDVWVCVPKWENSPMVKMKGIYLKVE